MDAPRVVPDLCPLEQLITGADHHEGVGNMAGARTEGCARLFAAAWFTGQSTSSQSGVRGQRSVAVAEAPAFPGTIACVFTWQP